MIAFYLISAALVGFAQTPISADDALLMLKQGNLRFVSGKAQHPNQTAQRRTEVANGQKPFAVVVTCSDSRVSPEIVFDRGLGDLFVVRTAGNVVDDVCLGSIEYAVEHLGVRLVVVIGHSSCGAVSAAVAVSEGKQIEREGYVGLVLKEIMPAVEAAKGMKGSVLENAFAQNARNMAAKTWRGLEPLKISGLRTLAGQYDLKSGVVTFFKP